jgi:threonine dehydrogenase-like Zn-dependent dehydrogenase
MMTKEKYIEAVKNREKNSVVQDLQWLIQCLNDTISDIHKDKITVDEIPEAYKIFINNNNSKSLHWDELQQEYREEHND